MFDNTELLKDIKDQKALKVLKNSDGGKILLASLEQEIRASIGNLSMYREWKYEDFVCFASKFNVLLDLYKVVANSDMNEKELLEILSDRKKKEADAQ